MVGKTIVIDNYDSFTYNLVQMIEEFSGAEPDVIRNDEITPEGVSNYENIILSPGPGVPKEAGNLLSIIEHNYQNKKILGVCLGLQAIGEVFGSELENLPNVYHGIQSSIKRTEVNCPLFQELPEQIDVGRYHSWVIDKNKVGDDLLITSYDTQGEIMSARHKDYSVYGVQFHPESILTPSGKDIIANFFKHG